MRLSSRAVLLAAALAVLPWTAAPASAEQGAMHEPTTGTVTSNIGYRCLSRTSDPDHYGYDIDNVTGTRIFAAYRGTVTVAGTLSGYGKVVYIRHPQGYETRYAHLSQIDVSVNQQVSREQRVGLMGETGAAQGDHLHFEIRRNGAVLNRNGHYSCGKRVTAKAPIPVAFPDLPA